MAQLTIVTTPQNSGDGTPLATAFNFCNSNFSELYSRVQTVPPASLVGQVGDTAGMYAYDDTFFYYCFADFDGSSICWGEIAQAGNITVTGISRGNSNVSIVDLGGNITTGVSGTPNVVVVASSGQFVTGVVSATGNISGDFVLGNGSQLTGLPQSYSNANVSAFLPTYTGNISAGNVAVTTAIRTNGSVSATGNITTAGFFIGDFIGNIVANITNIPGPGGAVVFNDGAGNAAATAGLIFDNSGPNVLTVDGTYSATGGVTATGNITGGNLTATSIGGTLTTAAQTNITSVGTLSSLAVTANIAGGNITTVGQVSATGNIRTTGFLFATQDLNVGGNVTATVYTGTSQTVTGNVVAGNLRTAGTVSAVGNITGNFFLGNGRQLTGIDTNTIQNGNSNVLIGTSAGNVSININGVSPVVIFTPLGQTIAGIISATGTITAGNVLTSGEISATGDIRGANVRTNGVITAAGNVTGGNIITAGNIQGGNILSSGVISTSGNITGVNFTAGNVDATVGNITCGNLLNGGSNGTGNIGSADRFFNTVFAQATSARYADLAEIYVPDADYAPGTVVVFGGNKEITVSAEMADERVAGAISTQPAHLMNAEQSGLPVALRGRIPINLIGPVVKGDSLITSATPGFAQSVGRDRSYGQAVFAKALETNDSPGQKTIIAVII